MSQHIGPVELLYYAPHVINSVSSVEELVSIVENNTENLASDLRTFLDATETTTYAHAFTLPSDDDATSSTTALGRQKFRMHELIQDIKTTQESDVLAIPAPDTSATLEVRPLLECSIDTPWITVVDDLGEVLGNIAIGLTIVVQSRTAQRTQHKVTDIDQTRFLLGDSQKLVSGGRCDIVAVTDTDPERLVRVQAFHEWRAHSAGGTVGSEASFNEDLYRLLYTPTDPSMPNMSSQEVYSHYLDHPGTIGSLNDLLSAAASADAQGASRVDTRLIMAPGSFLEFSAPTEGTITGITDANKIALGYADAVGVSEDNLVPTTSAVRALIDEAAPDAEAERYTRYLEVEDVLYAGRHYGGVHCPAKLTVDENISCDSLKCSGDAYAWTQRCSRLDASASVETNLLQALSVNVSNDRVQIDHEGIRITAGALHAPRCVLSNLSVTGCTALGPETSMGIVHAEDISVRSCVSARDLVCTDAIVNGVLQGQHAAVRSLEVGGMDVVSEISQLWSVLDSVLRRLAST